MSQFSETFKKIVLKRIENDSLNLPSMPAAALKCSELLRKSNIEVRQISATMETDPILAAQVLRLANSATYAGSAQTRTIEQALARLGMDKIRVLLTEASMHTVFQSRHAGIAQAARQVWEHSVAVALLSRDTASLIEPSCADAAYLGGLLHDIGKPVVASMLLEAEKIVGVGKRATWIDDAEWMETVTQCHRMVGVALAEKWNVADSLSRAIRDCAEYDPTDRLSPPNIVRFANAVAKAAGITVGPIDEMENTTILMIGRSVLGLDEELVDRMGQGLQERVRAQLPS